MIETELGATALIASQAAIALNPNAPETLGVTARSDPRRVDGARAGRRDRRCASAGIVVVVAVAAGRDGTPVLDVWMPPEPGRQRPSREPTEP